MNKPEYSDLYKFAVSLGVLLIAFSLLLPWIFLRESFDTQIKASEIAEFTQTAQALISLRQNTALWFVQNIIWISLIPAILGLIFLIGGLLLWQTKQKLLDRKDKLETEKLEIEIKNMSPEQIAVKAIEEVSISEDDLSEEAKVPVTSRQVKAIQEYFRTEEMVIAKLTKCFGSASIRTHQKIGKSNVDILARINNQDRVIFEVKRVTNPQFINRRKREISYQLSNAVHSYNEAAPGRKAYGTGIIIVGDDNSENSRDRNYERFSTTTINGFEITILTFAENEFVLLECAELLTILKNETNIKQ